VEVHLHEREQLRDGRGYRTRNVLGGQLLQRLEVVVQRLLDEVPLLDPGLADAVLGDRTHLGVRKDAPVLGSPPKHRSLVAETDKGALAVPTYRPLGRRVGGRSVVLLFSNPTPSGAFAVFAAAGD
jgi:hypothetical protein